MTPSHSLTPHNWSAPSDNVLQRNHFHNFPQLVFLNVFLNHILNGVRINYLISQASDWQVRSASQKLQSQMQSKTCVHKNDNRWPEAVVPVTISLIHWRNYYFDPLPLRYVKHARCAVIWFRNVQFASIDWPETTQNSKQTRLATAVRTSY